MPAGHVQVGKPPRKEAVGASRSHNLHDLPVEILFRDVAAHAEEGLMSVVHLLMGETGVLEGSQVGAPRFEQERLIASSAVEFAHRV